MGLPHWIYWVSWIITTFLLVTILTLVAIISGLLLKFDLFWNTPLIIIFLLFNTFGFSIAMVAFLIAILCPDVKNGATFGYGFILMTVVMQMFFT